MSIAIKTNPSVPSPVLIPDLGYFVPDSGGSVTLTENDEILEAIGSADLLELLFDDAFGAGSSTLVLNNGAEDIPQTEAADFLRGADDPPQPVVQFSNVILTTGGGLVYTTGVEFVLESGV